MQEIELTGNELTLEQIMNVARQGAKVSLSRSAEEKIERSRKVVEQLVDEAKVVYGVTTGFGMFSETFIEHEYTNALQKNLIVSHAVGAGNYFPEEIVRAAMLLRVNNFTYGYSGIRLKTVKTLIEMLNKGVTPLVPEKGSLGASGDLVPLAHMVLPVLGLGKATYHGKTMSGAEAMHAAGIPLLELTQKEGLALINGTQFMTAVCAGIAAGDASKSLEVISSVSDDKVLEIKKMLSALPVQVDLAENANIFDIRVTLCSEHHTASVRIADFHTNIVSKEVDGKFIFRQETEKGEEVLTDRSCLTVENIFRFANEVALDDIKPVLSRQIEYNMAIAEEGLKNQYGANIGKVLLRYAGNDVNTKARAYAAAGSDARMNGCEKPVVIISGSGNQGITASVPVIVYAKELGKSEEQMLRALVLSDLVTIHLKTDIGRLSAYCGAVSAGVGAGAGICYLCGGGLEEISHTIVNAIAIDSGIICDGAKASCAAKIAQAVEAGLFGCEMYKEGNQFYAGDGIVSKGVENTIKNVGRLAHDGMAQTDKEIINIMLHRSCQ